MAPMIYLQTEAADPVLAAALLRRRWQEKPAYFSARGAKPVMKPRALWQRLPGGAAPAMHWSNVHGVQN